ncbi:MAG TPA: LysM domain-containing protein [Solirubrobacterales bacterium]|nr:LysM domain-containing protein [Solirubrobacterales bacterium]
MNKRSSAPARVLAVTTLVVAFVVAIVAIGAALGGGDSNGSKGHRHGGGSAKSTSHEKRKVPATYEVQSGDTLISIARHNGVSVARIERLNPEVDPQILIAGEMLKLR